MIRSCPLSVVRCQRLPGFGFPGILFPGFAEPHPGLPIHRPSGAEFEAWKAVGSVAQGEALRTLGFRTLGFLRARTLPISLLLLLFAVPPLSASEPVDSTLVLFAQLRDARTTATGMVIDPQEGWVLTAQHFMNQGEKHSAILPLRDEHQKLLTDPEPYWNRLNQKQSLRVKSRWVQSASDLALIQIDSIPSSTRAIQLAKSSPKQGDSLSILGHPLSERLLFQTRNGDYLRQEKMTWRWSGQRIDARIDHLQGHSPFASGFSGGPVLNSQGELVGMILASPNPKENRVYAVDLSEVKSFLTRIYVLESIKAWLGGDRELAVRRVKKALALDAESGAAKLLKKILGVP